MYIKDTHAHIISYMATHYKCCLLIAMYISLSTVVLDKRITVNVRLPGFMHFSKNVMKLAK